MTRHAYRRFPAPGAGGPRARHFSGPSIPPPAPPPEFKFPDLPAIEFPTIEFPTPYDPEAAEAKRKRAEEIKAIRQIEQRRKGYRATLLTGGRGLEGQPTPDLDRPGLLTPKDDA